MAISIEVIVDSSGSMNEMGKSLLLRNLCRYISQLPYINPDKYMRIKFSFFLWSSIIDKYSTQENGDFNLIDPQGSSNLCILSEWLVKKVDNGEMLKTLLLTDGNFNSSVVTNYNKITSNYTNLQVLPVAIGADANITPLKKISTNQKVYLAENIPSAIDSLILRTSSISNKPKSINQIQFLQSVDTITEEDWDD